MKLKQFLRLAFGIVLAGSALSAAGIKANHTMSEAKAYASSPVMNYNGYQFVRYHSENNNPDQWGSYQSASNQSSKGTIALDDLSAVSITSATDGVRTINNTNYQMSGCATTTLTIKETTSSKQCSGLWLPIVTYLDNIPANAGAKVSIKYTVTIVGGSSNNYSVAYLYHLSTANNGAYGSGQTANIPSSATNITATDDNLIISIGNSSSTTSSSVSALVKDVSVINETDSLKGYMVADFVGLFIGARKDSSSSHQLTVTISSSIVSKTETTYVASCGGTLYESLSTAFNRSSDQDEITLLRDSEGSDVISFGNKTLYLNMNGCNYNGSFKILITGKLSVTGTGQIYNTVLSSYNGVIDCAGILEIGTNVTIENTSQTNDKSAIYSSGTLYFNGIAKSRKNPIYVASGSAYIRGGSVTSSSGYTITCGSSTNVYFSGTPSLVSTSSGYSNLYLLNSTSSVHGAYNSIYYTGNAITITFGNLPSSEFTIVDNMYDATRFTVSTTPNTGYTYKYDSSTKTLNYVKAIKYTITYDANGGTGSTIDSEKYDENSSATVSTNNFTYTYHTFLNWNTKADGSGTTYITGNTIKMTANVVLYAQWTQTNVNMCDELSNEYLKMNSYDTSLNNTSGSGLCTTYYASAKAYYLSMSTGAKLLFKGTSYTDACNRMIAWANANGEVFNPTAYTFVANSAPIMSNYVEENYVAVFALLACMVIVPCGLIFIRKRREF